MITLFLIISLIGCNEQVASKRDTVDEDIIKKVKTYERNEYLLYRLEITYEHFKDNVKDIVTESFSYKDNEIIFAYDGKIYKGIDLQGISIDELKEHKMNLEKYAEESGILPDETTYKISKIYDDKYREWKYVVVKKIMEFNDMNIEMHVNKVYKLIKEEEEWKILDISEKPIEWNNDKEEKLDVTKDEYTTVRINNETVEFIESFDPLEVD